MSATKPVVVRIPPNGREIHQNQWMVKQILDTGVAGLMFPHIETAEQALNAIKAVRYPQPAGAPNVLPEGVRGASNAIAARYWGMSGREYELRSDVWGLRPEGDMLVLLIIENKLGVENVRDIARTLKAANVKCVLWAGGGDLSLSYGHDAALTEAGLRKIIEAGKEFGLPVGINGTATSRSATRRASGCSSTSGRRLPAAGRASRLRSGRRSAADLTPASEANPRPFQRNAVPARPIATSTRER